MAKKSHTSSSFEHSLKRLEEIVSSLEEGSISLDDAMKMYEEGVKLTKECLDKLTNAELRLKQLSKDVNGDFKLSGIDLDEEP